MKGWKRSTVGILDEADLPQEARDYVDFIEQEIEAPVTLVSTGPRREETIVREHASLDRLTSGRLGRSSSSAKDFFPRGKAHFSARIQSHREEKTFSSRQSSGGAGKCSFPLSNKPVPSTQRLVGRPKDLFLPEKLRRTEGETFSVWPCLPFRLYSPPWGPLAQLVEQRTFNPRVQSSSL